MAFKIATSCPDMASRAASTCQTTEVPRSTGLTSTAAASENLSRRHPSSAATSRMIAVTHWPTAPSADHPNSSSPGRPPPPPRPPPSLTTRTSPPRLETTPPPHPPRGLGLGSRGARAQRRSSRAAAPRPGPARVYGPGGGQPAARPGPARRRAARAGHHRVRARRCAAVLHLRCERGTEQGRRFLSSRRLRRGARRARSCTLAGRLGDEVVRYVGHAPDDDVALLAVYPDGAGPY